MVPDSFPVNPFEKIALSCSGGGYRATAFHMGTMSYLNHIQYKNKPLLENIKLISTVSGGTISGVVYTLQKQRGKSFDEFYQFLYTKLKTLDLIKTGIEKLNPDSIWNNSSKNKNLINAFAEQYDSEFTQGATFADLADMNSHLEALVVNSTEFNNGVNFRFRNAGYGVFGNHYFQTDNASAGQVKLADAIAASSCFPGGFEPILWPHDFVHDKSNLLNDLKMKMEPVGLMDGGIYDNQGIDSILSYKKSDGSIYFNLVIISDVSSPYMDGYKPLADQIKSGFRKFTIGNFNATIKRYNRNINIALIVISVVFAAISILSHNKYMQGFGAGIATTFMLLLLTKVYIFSRIKKSVTGYLNQLLSKIPSFYRTKLSALHIEELSIRRFEPLIVNRLNSLVILLMDVFLKIVRRLNYYKLYDDDTLRFKRMSCLIKELTEVDFNNKIRINDQNDQTNLNRINNSCIKGTYNEIVGSSIKAVAEEASSFGTTLWFSDQDNLNEMLRKLIATGQFTTCYNTIDYLEKLIYNDDSSFDSLTEEVKQEVNQLYNQCKKDWIQFKLNPMFLMDQLDSRIKSE